MRLDLHIHSVYSSDGVLQPEEIVQIARKRGLSGIAITDHNTIAGGKEAKKFETDDFKVIVGAEIATDKGDVIGLFLSEEIRSRVLADVLDEIRAAGGLVVIPHPFDRMRHSAFHISEEYVRFVDAIEGFNSRCVFQSFNREAMDFAARFKIPVVGGSDAHYRNEIGLGGVVTRCDDIRWAITHSDLRLFGRHSSLMNHVRTKIGKLRRKAAG